MLRFILVNDRMPRAQAYCALCCTQITAGYVREIGTKFCYCSRGCFLSTRDWGSSCLNTVRGPRHEMRSLPQTGKVVRLPLLGHAILLEDLRSGVSGAA